MTVAADAGKTPFQKVVDAMSGGCGCACHTGVGYRTSCEHCAQSAPDTTQAHADTLRVILSGFAYGDGDPAMRERELEALAALDALLLHIANLEQDRDEATSQP